ncbi:hypothetical protein Mal52_30600 [Symmachiella dynata]|uniref:DUF4177 domain-containing protein n=1 Tax=Symmachiella dynata TaxID=2527995 RepID=A0A517ZQ13_9PLAN|nr:hypothetical protein [Symmachiella dynata]QDU44576.1 hypothetical protein Mal52_30600 [Symmachiella dynata]
MKFVIAGVDRVTGAERRIEVEAESEKEALAMASAEGIMPTSARASKKPKPQPKSPAPPVPDSVPGPYTYKMVQIYLGLQVVNERGNEAAHHMQTAVNEWAEHGWEFYRADRFDVFEPPGCIGILLSGLGIWGSGLGKVSHYHVLTFRSPHPRHEF